MGDVMAMEGRECTIAEKVPRYDWNGTSSALDIVSEYSCTRFFSSFAYLPLACDGYCHCNVRTVLREGTARDRPMTAGERGPHVRGALDGGRAFQSRHGTRQTSHLLSANITHNSQRPRDIITAFVLYAVDHHAAGP